MHFFVFYNKYPVVAVSEEWSQSAKEILRWNWCDDVMKWYDEFQIIVNLGQKYEGNLVY